MLNKGYKTRYLNERLSMGLAAENLTGYFVQRERWCQGNSNTLSSQRPTARTWSVTFSTHHVPSAVVVGAVSGALYDIDHPDLYISGSACCRSTSPTLRTISPIRCRC
ncbi:hypothetical protein ACOJBO_21530 [Rhizobium beringeri]